MAFDWKAALRKGAPALAAAIANPGTLAAHATQILAGVLLGKPDATEDEISAKVESMTAAEYAEVRKADQGFALEMSKIAQAGDAISAQDTANARDMKKETHSTTPDVISYAILIMFGIELILSHFYAVQPSNHDFASQANNTLNLAVATVLGFWLGGAYSSRTQGATIAKALDKR